MMDCITKNWKIIVILSFMLNTSLTMYALYVAKYQNRIYTIGINRLTDSFTKELNTTNLSREQQSMLLVDFAKGLDSSLIEFKAKGNLLMMEEAVLSGGFDITEQVVANIKQRINHDK
jgi:hypothetical protein